MTVDISIFATIGLTVASVIGILIVLAASMRKR